MASVQQRQDRGLARQGRMRLQSAEADAILTHFDETLAELDAANPQARPWLTELLSTSARLRALLEGVFIGLPEGIAVAPVSERLRMSPRAVERWVEEGRLAEVPGRYPTEITAVSVLALERVLERIRATYPAQSWSSLVAYLHDQDLQGQDWFAEGVAQYERGEYVTR